MAQLFRMARRDFTVVGRASRVHRPVIVEAGTFPVARWPNGRYCLPVGLFLAKKLLGGCRSAPNGGTLKTYACYMAPLVRYCYEFLGGNFLNFTDYDLTVCLNDILEEEDEDATGAKVQKRMRNTVRQMGSLWIEFLHYFGEWSAYEDFVAAQGVIRAEKVEKKGPHGTLKVWVHSAMPPSDPYNYHHPMSQELISALRKAAATLSSTPFEKTRRLAMLDLFIEVGFRRIEASLLSVSDVQAAIDNMLEARDRALERAGRGLPIADDDDAHRSFALTFRVRKHRKGKVKYRTTPVSAVLLQRLKEYLEERQVEIQLLGTKVSSDDPFFVNMSTGNAYMPNFFTQEFARLGALAGVTDARCSPHPVRGRFLVDELVRLAVAHFQNNPPGEPGRYVVDFNDFLAKLQEISGHASLEALKVYVQFAKEEFANISKSMERVDEMRTVSAMKRARDEFDWDIKNGVAIAVAAERLRKALEVLDLMPETTQGRYEPRSRPLH